MRIPPPKTTPNLLVRPPVNNKEENAEGGDGACWVKIPWDTPTVFMTYVNHPPPPHPTPSQPDIKCGRGQQGYKTVGGGEWGGGSCASGGGRG